MTSCNTGARAARVCARGGIGCDIEHIEAALLRVVGPSELPDSIEATLNQPGREFVALALGDHHAVVLYRDRVA